MCTRAAVLHWDAGAIEVSEIGAGMPGHISLPGLNVRTPNST